ncbi:MAG: multiple sugar transport system substrate-binding protein, partial [Chloroflexia bacterium]|nr:multiple sugar transport system substrate-binding protein [Chloroflexia bacterium]
MWSKARKSISLLAITSILCTMLAACGGDSGTSTATTGSGAGQATVAATPAGNGGAATETTAPAVEATDTTAPAAKATDTTAPTGGGDATATTGNGGGQAGGLKLAEGCTNVELSYWNPFTGPDGPFMGQLVDQFNTDNPNIKATMTTQADYYTQIQTAAASDTLPDVAIIHVDQVPTWAFRNVLRPIDEIASATGLSQSDYPAAVWNGGMVAGHRYSVPLDIHPMTMFYNEDLLTAAGITAPPTNRADFEKAAQAITDKGQKGFMLTAGFPVQQIFSMLLYQFGGTWFNQDGTKAAWNSDAGVKALQWMKDAQGKWSEPNLEVDAELAAFKAGNAGMIWNGIWQTTNVTGEGVSFKGKATAVPQIGDKPATWAGSHQLTLPVHKAGADKCKDSAATIFIKYLVDHSIT